MGRMTSKVEVADLLRRHEDQVQRLAEGPVLGADSAQQIIAESAEVNNSGRSPHGNPHMRRILNQAANSAVKLKGSIFEILYRCYVPRLGHKHTIAIIAYKLCRLIWKILQRGMHYEECGPEVNKKSKQARAQKMIRELRRLGYCVEPTAPQPAMAT